jgi:hypothetical protein
VWVWVGLGGYTSRSLASVLCPHTQPTGQMKNKPRFINIIAKPFDLTYS